MRRHAVTDGIEILVFDIDFDGTSRMQYAKFRMPMSMLRTRVKDFGVP